MQWLITIFESTSDQARLVTTIIAAVIAVAVVLLNQWFTSRRARKEKLISKIEEIYSALIKMQHLKSAIHAEIVSGYPGKPKITDGYIQNPERDNKEIEWQRKLDGMRDKFSEFGANAYMLTGLYFPSLSKNIGDIWTCFDGIYGSFLESETFNDYMDGSSKHLDNISIHFLNTFEALTKIMEKTMH